MPARGLLVALVLSCAVLPSFATTYEAVTFVELVTRADIVFVGEVIDVRPYPVSTRERSIIKTRVVFRVQDPLIGTTSALEALDFLGGEWGDLRLEVADMPTFVLGDRRFVFARRTASINPIVGFRQGLLRVERDGAGVDRVWTLERLPVSSPESIGTRLLQPGTGSGLPMRLSDFRERVLRTLSEARGR